MVLARSIEILIRSDVHSNLALSILTAMSCSSAEIEQSAKIAKNPRTLCSQYCITTLEDDDEPGRFKSDAILNTFTLLNRFMER